MSGEVDKRLRRATTVESFPPIASERSTRLILGSMPGVASLGAQRYYAHPHNAFWRILGEHLGLPIDAPYESRVAALDADGIALWDVLARCERPGSLDSAIRRDSEVANDIPGLLARCPGIDTILFNGGAAEAGFCRHHGALLGSPRLRLVRLPSTSPAHASLAPAQKAAVWLEALRR